MEILIFFAVVLVLSLIILKVSDKISDKKHKKALSSHQTIEERLAYYNRNGWTVHNESDERIYLIRKKEFSFFWGLLWFLFFGIGFIVYLIYYFSKSDETFTFNKKAFLEKRNI